MGRTSIINNKGIPQSAIPNLNANLKKLFEMCDANGDKKLSKDELKVAFKKLNSHVPGFRAWRGLANADGNGDGNIDLDNEELDALVKYAVESGFTMRN